MKGNYMSPAKNAYGACLPCPDNHPDVVEKCRRGNERVYPEYKGVSDAYRDLFKPEIIDELPQTIDPLPVSGMSISTLFSFVDPLIRR